MIALVSFPSICKSKINFAALVPKPDPDTKVKLEQLSEVSIDVSSIAQTNGY